MWENAGSQISALAFEVEIYLLHFYWTRYPVTSESHPESHVVPCSLMRVPPTLRVLLLAFFMCKPPLHHLPSSITVSMEDIIESPPYRAIDVIAAARQCQC